jgi:integrase
MRGEPRIRTYRGVLCVVWRERGATKRFSLNTIDPEVAKTGFAQWKHDRANVSARPNGPLTVGKILDAYLEARPQVIPRPVLRRYFSHHLAEHVSQELVDQYAKARKASKSTAKTELGLLRTALSFAAKRKWIDPVAGFDLPAGSPPRERWITKEEADRLIESAVLPHVRLFITIARWTGARAGAILDLTWDRVHQHTIDFQPPERAVTRKRRAQAPISPVLRKALEEERRRTSGDYVIEFGGGPVKSIKKGFKAAADRAKLEKVTPHTMRHSVATWLAMDGVSMRKIADLLGHTSVEMVERVYAKFSPGYLADVVESLNSAPPVHTNRFAGGKTGTASKTKKRGPQKPRNGAES